MSRYLGQQFFAARYFGSRTLHGAGIVEAVIELASRVLRRLRRRKF